MKTLEEIENMVHGVGKAFLHTAIWTRGSVGYKTELANAERLQSELITGLATIHTLASLKAQELRGELEALERQDALHSER